MSKVTPFLMFNDQLEAAIVELPSNKGAIAKACRCDQELRVFQFDPES